MLGWTQLLTLETRPVFEIPGEQREFYSTILNVKISHFLKNPKSRLIFFKPPSYQVTSKFHFSYNGDPFLFMHR